MAEKGPENIPEKTELTQEWDEEMHAIVQSAKRRFPEQDRDDCLQELRIWWLSTKWPGHYLAQDSEEATKKLKKAMFRQVTKFCQAERASRLGYKPEDLFHYTTAALRELLPRMFDPEDWLSGGEGLSDDIRSRKPANEGGGLMAALADVSRAFDRLREQDRLLLTYLYRFGHTEADLALVYEVTEEALNTRHDRALAKLRDILGGDQNPYHEGPGARRAETNAAALTRRRLQEEGSWTPRSIRQPS